MLYADKIIFLLTDPVNLVITLLDSFAQGSGYKINISKSVRMGLNLTLEVKAEFNTMADLWRTHIKYLGIKLTDTMDPTSLIDLNLKPIISSTKAQLGRWQKQSLSWMGWVAAASEISFCL